MHSPSRFSQDLISIENSIVFPCALRVCAPKSPAIAHESLFQFLSWCFSILMTSICPISPICPICPICPSSRPCPTILNNYSRQILPGETSPWQKKRENAGYKRCSNFTLRLYSIATTSNDIPTTQPSNPSKFTTKLSTASIFVVLPASWP